MDKNKKIIWGAVAVTLVVAGIYFYSQQAGGPDSMTDTATTTRETASSNTPAVGNIQGTAVKAPADELKSLDEQLMNLEIPEDKDLSDTDLGL